MLSIDSGSAVYRITSFGRVFCWALVPDGEDKGDMLYSSSLYVIMLLFMCIRAEQRGYTEQLLVADILFFDPVFEHVFRSVTDQDMDVIDTTDTLQRNPVLEPENMILAFARAKDCVQFDCKRIVHELLNQMPRVVGDITSAGIRLNGCLHPNTDVNDAFVQSIRPVVLEYPEVILDLERDRITKLKLWWITRSRRGQRGPVKALLNNEVGDGTILCLGLRRPRNVATKVRGTTLQLFQTIGSWFALEGKAEKWFHQPR
jgi:hypothetical protein